MPRYSVRKLLRMVSEEGCDELIIAAGAPVAVRLKDHVVRLEVPRLTPEDTAELMYGITPESNRREVESDGSTQFDVTVEDDSRFHVSVFKELTSFRIVALPLSEEV